MKSAAGGEAGGEARRQVGGEDSVLRGFQVVGRSVEVDDLGFGIEEGEGSAPISVAGLSNGAGIDQVTGVPFQLQRDRLGLADGAVFRTETIGTGTVGEESALQVSMAEESQGHGECDERSEGVAERNDIDVFVDGRAVNQLHIGKVSEGEWALRQSAQPFEMFGSELVAGPDGGGGGHSIEVVQVEQAGCGLIVIAADKDRSQAAGALDDFVGARAVTDDVAEVCDEIERRSCGEAGLQRFEVGVNVAKQQYSQ